MQKVLTTPNGEGFPELTAACIAGTEDLILCLEVRGVKPKVFSKSWMGAITIDIDQFLLIVEVTNTLMASYLFFAGAGDIGICTIPEFKELFDKKLNR